jgi:hypothetical protein
MAASRVMGTGTPQRLAMRRGNALGAKVLTDRLTVEEGNMATIQGVIEHHEHRTCSG